MSLVAMTGSAPAKFDHAYSAKDSRAGGPSPLEESYSGAKAAKDAAAVAGKDLFTDSTPILLPASIGAKCKGWVRCAELAMYADSVGRLQVWAPKPADLDLQPGPLNNHGDEARYSHGLTVPACAWAEGVAKQLMFVLQQPLLVPKDQEYLWQNINPKDAKTGVPRPSTNGKYIVRMFHQQEWRAIVIDDRVILLAR